MQPELTEVLTALRADPEAVPVDGRRRAARRAGEMLLCGVPGVPGVPGDAGPVELLELLARDGDWSVRLESAKLLHLLDDEACSRIAAMLREDRNSYVRSHAERGLTRQRRSTRASARKRSEGSGYGDQIDVLARQHGKHVASKVMALADQRFGMLADAVGHDVRRILTTLAANIAALEREHGATERTASIREDVTFLKHTVDAMEQFSKPLPEQRHPEDLRQMIDQAIEKALACIAEHGHDPQAVEVVVAEVPTIRPRVARRLIVLALTNVIQNALESFADREVDALRPGRIEVQVVVDGYETRIIIRDTGPGLEPEVLEHLSRFMPIGPSSGTTATGHSASRKRSGC